MIDDEFGFVVNCSFPGSLRIINSNQRAVLDAIDGNEDVAGLGQKLDMDAETLRELLAMMARTEIVRFDGAFTRPAKPQETDRLNFWIHTTNACNLSCGYCYISTLNTGKAMSERVRTRLIDKLVRTVEKWQIKQVKFRLAGGEPLSQFRSWEAFIPEATTALAEVGCQFDCAFLTNLTILNDEILTFSKRHRITYGVSLDGMGNAHDATRKFRSGEGSFQVVDANIDKLIASGIPVSVNTVVSNQNLKGLGDLTRYLIELNIPFRYSIVKGENVDAQLLDSCLSHAFAIMEEAM
ncbi:radical SAM protein [Dyadobacter sp. CY261]|uniref:radical SAM protein n=1 Tax=Dyadobacter sp. CY261 TaxID=2907203 RepID=UPI001F32355B|nr:radical SAM protein [Dyadobacter sp. CY261]